MFINLTVAGQSQAFDCACTANPYTKTYAPNGVEKTWYGAKRIWSCVYTCENGSGLKEEFRGHHRDWYVGDDTGLWGVCDGLVYIYEYNAYAQRFVWTYNRVGTFDPVDSKSPQVKAWAQQNCSQ
jgi:hypothetical protein